MTPAARAALFPPEPPPSAAGKPRWRKALALVGWALLGGAIGLALARFGPPRPADLPPGTFLALLAGALLSLWPHIVLHEAGHALAGLSRGMQAIGFGIGPLRLERDGDGRWRWRHGGGIRGVGGFAALLPRGERGLSRGDQVVFALGGPLANLLTASLCAVAVVALPLPVFAAAALAGAGLAALVYACVNLASVHFDTWRSDGRVLLDLLRGTPDAALQMRITQLMAASLAGMRPREWPDTAMPEIDDPRAGPALALTARTLRLSRAIDRRDAVAAHADATVLAAHFFEVPQIQRPAVAISLASHAAVLVEDGALAAAWRPHCEGGLLDMAPYRRWLDAEIARLAGDPATAASHIERARALAGRIPDAASRLVFDERLAALARQVGTDTRG